MKISWRYFHTFFGGNEVCWIQQKRCLMYFLIISVLSYFDVQSLDHFAFIYNCNSDTVNLPNMYYSTFPVLFNEHTTPNPAFDRNKSSVNTFICGGRTVLLHRGGNDFFWPSSICIKYVKIDDTSFISTAIPTSKIWDITDRYGSKKTPKITNIIV